MPLAGRVWLPVGKTHPPPTGNVPAGQAAEESRIEQAWLLEQSVTEGPYTVLVEALPASSTPAAAPTPVIAKKSAMMATVIDADSRRGALLSLRSMAHLFPPARPTPAHARLPRVAQSDNAPRRPTPESKAILDGDGGLVAGRLRPLRAR